MRYAIIASAVVFGMAVGAGGLWLATAEKDFDFNECMLRNLKGQPNAARGWAYDICLTKYSSIPDKPKTGPADWGAIPDNPKGTGPDDWKPVGH